MSDPRFLTVDQIHLLHGKAIERFGGLSGTRDRNALESAVIQPRNVYYYAHGDLHDVAAAYCFHIADVHLTMVTHRLPYAVSN